MPHFSTALLEDETTIELDDSTTCELLSMPVVDEDGAHELDEGAACELLAGLCIEELLTGATLDNPGCDMALENGMDELEGRSVANSSPNSSS